MSKKYIKEQKSKATHYVAQLAIIIILIVFAALQTLPFYLQIVSSLQPLDLIPVPGKIYLLPVSWNWKNYLEAIERIELLQGIVNTLIVSVSYLLLSSLVILLTGYTLGKKHFAGKQIIKISLLLTMAVPGELLMVSNYLLVSSLRWTNSFTGLILPGIVNITGIFLIMSFMNTIPDAILESADIVGAGELRKIFYIVVPNCIPVLATYWILTFIAQWNDYLWPMVVVNDRVLFTVQLKLKEFNPYYFGFADETLKSAAHIFSLIPVIILYILCQDRFVSGVTLSGLKD